MLHVLLGAPNHLTCEGIVGAIVPVLNLFVSIATLGLMQLGPDLFRNFGLCFCYSTVLDASLQCFCELWEPIELWEPEVTITWTVWAIA